MIEIGPNMKELLMFVAVVVGSIFVYRYLFGGSRK